MRTCAHCGHANADHVAYCSGCGKRLRPPSNASAAAAPPQAAADTLADARTSTLGSSGFAATVALGPALGTAKAGAPPVVTPLTTTTAARAREAVGYVFATIRGRIDAEERRRHLTGEREGAKRMAESILVELGHTVLVQTLRAPALGELSEAAARIKRRRDNVVADLAAAEKFQAAEDLRLGLLEAGIETECKAYERSVADVELTLARNTSDRQAVDGAVSQGGGPPSPRSREASTSDKMKLDDQHRSLRERASALRASSLAARARLDQAVATRRQTAAAVAASVAGHTRERAAIDEETRNLTAQIGARALELRIASPYLAPGYERLDRLQETIRAHEAELARLERSKGGLDRQKLALGLGVICAVVGVIGAGVWALLLR